MENNSQQQKKVKNFFDNISSDYHKKYSTDQPFLNFYFQQRLQEATASFSFENKSVLDIGAGTGELFHFLQNKTSSFEYFATDIAPKMLEQSGIPTSQYFAGDIDAFPFPQKKYDYIFLLGVTTYFNQAELKKHLDFIKNHLSPDGTAVLSFTNRSSFDWKLRQVLRFITPLFKSKKNVLTQEFKVFAYSPKAVAKIFTPQFSIQKFSFLNQSFPFINRLFPKTSISLSHFLKKNIQYIPLLSFLSSDFLVTTKSKSKH